MGRVPTIYFCSYENCSASYNRKHRYETHIRSHTGERPFICSHDGCEKSFTSSSHLKRHEDTHGSSYRCTVENCPAILKTKYTLKKHLKKIHFKIKSKVYTCTHCGKEFNKHNNLQRHELRHSGQLPYICSAEDCGKAFLTPSKLKRHMKIHEGYPCKAPHCDKVFEKWTLYIQHLRDSHRPEIKCQVCDKVFSTSFNLKSHIPLHDESRLVYQCEVPNCSRYYFAKRNLKWHMRKYHAKRPFMCDKEKCHKSFKTEADLDEHILYHGKKKPRKKKNKSKKPKPSLAAKLSGYAEVDQVNSNSKQVSTESTASISSSKIDLTEDSFEQNESSARDEKDSSALDINCTKPFVAISVLNLLKSIQSSTLKDKNTLSSNSNDGSSMESETAKLESKDSTIKMEQSSADESGSLCFAKHIPMECEIDYSRTDLKSPESTVQEYTTIEVVGSDNLSQLIYVPVIKIGS